MISQAIIDTEVERLLDGVPEGEGLDERQVVLLGYGLRVSSSALDVEGSRTWVQRATEAGVSYEELQEVVTLMTSIGVHAFFESSRDLAAAAAPEGGWGDFDPERQALWDRYIGTSSYWTSMREEIPGFLESLLWMSPAAFEAFIRYVGLPFRAKIVDTLTLELISMAADACPSHQYLPGMRMHLRNAVNGGAGSTAIRQAMRMAAESPSHVGVR